MNTLVAVSQHIFFSPSKILFFFFMVKDTMADDSDSMMFNIFGVHTVYIKYYTVCNTQTRCVLLLILIFSFLSFVRWQSTAKSCSFIAFKWSIRRQISPNRLRRCSYSVQSFNFTHTRIAHHFHSTQWQWRRIYAVWMFCNSDYNGIVIWLLLLMILWW